MEGTFSLQDQDIFSTQTLEKGEILDYGFAQEKLFKDPSLLGDLSDEYLRFFITRWEFKPSLPVQPKPQRLSGEKGDIRIAPDRSEEIKIIQIAKQWHRVHLKGILKEYEGKYIAIILNPMKGIHTPLKEAIIGSAKDFHRLASKVYGRYGYKTIYMPFVTKSLVKREFQIPTPLWIKRK